MASIITNYKYFDYRPPNTANLNDNNGDFAITIHNEDLITHPYDSLLELRGKIMGTLPEAPARGDADAGPPIDITAFDFTKFKLAANPWLYMFDRFDYYIGENKIDTVRKPGTTCLMKGLASFSDDKLYCDAGWNYSSKDGENTLKSDGWFVVTIPMRIIMGFFEDHKSYIYNMVQKLVFYKTATALNNMFELSNDYVDGTFTIDLKDVIWKMPHVKLDLENTTKIRSEISAGNKFELFWRKWVYNNISHPSGTDFTWDIPVSYS